MEHYLALFEPDHEAGGYVVTLPDFGYGATQGETYAEAMEMAQDLLMLQAAKVDLYIAFLESRMRKAELARRIGIPKTHVDRLFSLRHHSRLDRIERAFAALGKRLHVEARNAA